MAPQAELGCSLTTWLQRGGRVCLPAGVSPGEEEEGLHHGALVSLPLLLWGLSRGCGARQGSQGRYVEPSSSLRGSGTNSLVLVGKPRPVPALFSGREEAWVPWGRRQGSGGVPSARRGPAALSPLPPSPRGQKYMTSVVKLFGPLTRNYYVRAVLHLL